MGRKSRNYRTSPLELRFWETRERGGGKREAEILTILTLEKRQGEKRKKGRANSGSMGIFQSGPYSMFHEQTNGKERVGGGSEYRHNYSSTV